MTATIYQLRTFKSVITSSTGVKFPQVYRAFHPSEPKVPLYYTLDFERTFWKEEQKKPIQVLSPAIDSGWLMIRHHRKEKGRAFIEGYDEALFNHFVGNHDGVMRHMTYESDEGFFTLQHRDPTPNTPNHLIIYAATLPDAETNPLSAIDEWQIVMPDGSLTTDSDVLYDPNMAPEVI